MNNAAKVRKNGDTVDTLIAEGSVDTNAALDTKMEPRMTPENSFSTDQLGKGKYVTQTEMTVQLNPPPIKVKKVLASVKVNQ